MRMRAKKLLTSRQIFRYAVPARTVTKKHWYDRYRDLEGDAVCPVSCRWTRDVTAK